LIKSFSHELRTPITAVMYFIEIAYKSKEVPEEIKTNLMNALISSKQLFYQINNFIDLSNILNGKFRLLKETFDLRK
jgi:Osmosensitive K+ channel histidine kinase